MASGGETPAEEPSSPAKRKRKLNVRLGDLGEAKSKGGRAGKSTTPRTGDRTEASGSGAKPPKRKRASPAVDNSGNEADKPDSGTKATDPAENNNSGAENQNKTSDSKSKGSKGQKRISTKTTANDKGAKNQKKKKTLGSKSGPKRPKHNSPKTTANDLAEHNQDADQNGGSGLAEMGGIHGWLNRLGLGKYIELFDKHEVDVEVLPIITLDDLKEMGISAVGTRRKLYDAIQKLSWEVI